MVNKYYLTNKAKEDLESIFKYISHELLDPDSALSLIRAFEDKFEDIVLFPESYPLIISERLLVQGLRKARVKNHVIVYGIDEADNTVLIMRVIYQREDYL